MLLSHILPPTVKVSETCVDRCDITLFQAEARAIEYAVTKRRNEFVTVRACAREALRALGSEIRPLVPGLGGAPTWPNDVVGSMTHCAGFSAAAVARRTEFDGIGIDAEPNKLLPPDVLEVVARLDEITMLHAQQETNHLVALDRVLFCVKEAIYKAWFPIHGDYLAYNDIQVQLSRGFFTAILRPSSSRSAATFQGKWIAANGFICAATTLAKGQLATYGYGKVSLKVLIEDELNELE